MLHEKGINWNDTPTKYKRGTCLYYKHWTEVHTQWGGLAIVPAMGRGALVTDFEMPILTENREYIERHI
jgi:hypothetical protein